MSGGGGKGSLKSFPVPSVMEDEEQDAVDEEIHRDEDVSIKASGAGRRRCMVGGLDMSCQPPCHGPPRNASLATPCCCAWRAVALCKIQPWLLAAVMA